MNLREVSEYIITSGGSRDADEYVLEWIESSSTDDTARELVTLLFESRE